MKIAFVEAGWSELRQRRGTQRRLLFCRGLIMANDDDDIFILLALYLQEG